MFPAAIRILVLSLALSGFCRADDAFFAIPIHQLTLTDGTWPAESPDAAKHTWSPRTRAEPYAALDTPGEAYISRGDPASEAQPWGPAFDSSASVLFLKAPAGADSTGTLFIPDDKGDKVVPLRFAVHASQASPDARDRFYRFKSDHYRRLQHSGAPGAAWFRHQADQAQAALPESLRTTDSDNARTRPEELDDTYALFSGGRALAENLQLDRPLRASSPAEPDKPVPLSTLTGITVAEMDWSAALAGATPALDPLAAAIPADQHAVFMPNVAALATILTHPGSGLPGVERPDKAPALAEFAAPYERQLGITLPTLVTLATSTASVCLTGSDPYFRTGTDIALVLESRDAAALATALHNQVAKAIAQIPSAAVSTGDTEGVHYQGWSTPDRTVSTYIAPIGNAVVLTNSTAQIRRLAAVHAGHANPTSSLPEYKFFRSRYPLNTQGETALIFLSDAAIRRWCGPEWRIGASRRLRAASVLADATAEHMDELVAGVEKPHSIETAASGLPMGDITLAPSGVRFSTYGTLHFITPIAELAITEATAEEADAYTRWRDSYQNGWRWAFDPIALSLSADPGRLSADLTVMPLIASTDYHWLIDLSKGAAITTDAADPHEALAQFAAAINMQSEPVRQTTAMGASFAPGLGADPFSWVGQSISFYADPDPFWTDMASTEDPESFMEKNLHRLPVAAYAESTNPLKLAAFLTALHAFIDQTAPGMTGWETRTYKDQGYVRVGPSASAKAQYQNNQFDTEIALYYAAMPRALILSLNESVLQHAIEREQARRGPNPPADSSTPWLGKSLCLHLGTTDPKLFQFMDGRRYISDVDQTAWQPIPILNEWRRRYPDRDPVKIEREVWGETFSGPSRDAYQWDDRLKTMASTAYGSPGDPHKPAPAAKETSGTVNLGITFEDHGLRARIIQESHPANP